MRHRNLISTFIIVIVITTALPVVAATATLPAGAKLQVRINERLSSETAKPGDTFHGTLAQPVVVNGKTLFDKATDVKGEVMEASKSGRLSSPGQLQLVLTSISGGWFRSYPLTVQPLVINGGSHTKSNVAKIGGGAAAGAIIGGVAAGSKGAAIGAGAGAGTGTVLAATTGKREAVVESEAILTWIATDTQLRPANAANVANRNNYRDDRAERDRDDDHYASHGRDHHDDDDHYANHGRDHHDDDEDDDGDRRGDDRRDGNVFSAHDRVILRGCLSDNSSNLPPGLAKRDRLPPGLERHLQRNGTLPPGLQKRVQPLPEACEVQLPRLPREWERVILSGRIILLDGAQTIRDILELREKD
jgi:hypothetical protein